MDISMVLNSAQDDLCIHERHDGRVDLQPDERYPLPPMRTQLSSSTSTQDRTLEDARPFNCPNCFQMAHAARYYSQEIGPCGHHCSATPSGYQQPPIHDKTHYDPQPVFRLPPIETFHFGYEWPKRDSWGGISGPRVKLEDVLLNPKKSPRRASLSPTMSAMGYTHSLSSRPHSDPHSPTPHSQPLTRRTTHRSSIGITGRHSPHPGRSHNAPDGGQSSSPSPEDLYAVEGEYDESSTASRNAACNKPYNPAQVDWIRYSKVDLGLSYKAMGERFAQMWPGESKTEHCFSARFYRDNYVPRVGVDGRVMRDDKGEPIMEPAKMRDTKTAAGKQRCVPYSLVERYPWRALEYPWVSKKSKALAREIMNGNDPKDPTGAKARWREVFFSIEKREYRNFI